MLHAARQPDYPAEIVLVGCNRSSAAAIARAAAAGIPVCLADRAATRQRTERQLQFAQALHAATVDLVVLAGFDEILTPAFVQAYAGRIVNTHPSLLPAFGGTMHAVDEALAHGVKVTGCTIHLVTNDLDGGPILLQQCVAIEDTDDAASLHARIREQEHRLLPAAIRAFAEGRVHIEGHRARVIASDIADG
ncbi:MAG TPA: phosphoribosylglycinamide formyltransferase [Chloroflexota bacterium]|nr:phosphoribosylglycinamide formyltransferase [Chloroflexota bacterium]